jgi:hypothetical protein
MIATAGLRPWIRRATVVAALLAATGLRWGWPKGRRPERAAAG